LVPEGFHLEARDLGKGGSLLAGEAFHGVKATREFGAGFFEGDFGIDVEEAGKIDGDEEDVAQFGFDRGCRGRKLTPRCARDNSVFVGWRLWCGFCWGGGSRRGRGLALGYRIG